MIIITGSIDPPNYRLFLLNLLEALLSAWSTSFVIIDNQKAVIIELGHGGDGIRK